MDTVSSAVISECGTYRYCLERKWDSSLPAFRVVMLNPSTADASQDDPTIRRCMHFAKREGCGSLLVLNLFAFRATAPAVLEGLSEASRIGPENDAYFKSEIGGRNVLVAWGSSQIAKTRAPAVLELLRGNTLYCLGTTKDGSPRHPLYVKGDQPLIPYGAHNAQHA